MVMETIEKVLSALGSADVDQRLEEQLIDGLLYAFQEQQGQEDAVMLSGFGVVVNSLGLRIKPYLPQICGIIKVSALACVVATANSVVSSHSFKSQFL
jgi:splicing factor 3B subunit 1